MNNNTTVSTTTAMPLGSQKKHRKVEHCRVDFSKNAIVITRDFARRASIVGTPEFKRLSELCNAYPSLTVITRTARKGASKNSTKGLTMAFMENYIAHRRPNDKNLYNRQVEVSKAFKSPYVSVQSLLLQVGGKTGILYTESIESMKKFISFAREQGIRADGFWSIREESQEKHPMTAEQIALRQTVLEQETIPENIDLLVINAASETCIKIQGEKRKVDYMIIHHTNEETQTQVRGRYCGDLPKLYLHSTTLNPMEIVVPTDFLGRKLFPEDKEALCRTLNLANPKGGYYKWRKVCSLLEESNYSVEMGRENYKRYAIIRSKPRDSD